MEEVEIAIKQLKRNKTPGLDGIGIEFYQEMLNEIKYLVHLLILEIVETQELNKSACQGLISLLDKPGKDQLIVANWRPLSLLCCDYKIFAKILANRLSMVTKYLIHPDQSGFLKGQFISENLMDLNAVLTITELEQIPASLISIDFQKANDNVQWPALYEILSKFGMGPNIIKMIKICQTNLTSAVINNGYRSDWFDVQKGLRQGCPLSCQLFVCFIDAIAAKICQEKGIIGIQWQGKEKKLAQYADDLWIVLRHIESSYKKLFYVLDQFSVFSGLKINYDKT